MPPQNPFLRTVHSAVSKVPGLLHTYRKLKGVSRRDPLITAAYRKLFNYGRLRLPSIDAELLGPAAGSIELPVQYPLFAGEDTPLIDLLFLLNLAKGRRAKRILEVGTYRARTTYALHLNCPGAAIVSYDIQVLDSAYRQLLGSKKNVQLRHGPFAESAQELRQEPRYDFIFVDGSHRMEDVINDSRLALELVSDDGIIIWHDYRPNDFFTDELRVPEGLETLRPSVAIFAVSTTMCAVHLNCDRNGLSGL